MAGRAAVWRVDVGAGPRLAVGPLDEGPSVFLPPALRVTDLLQPGRWEAIPGLAEGGDAVPAGARILTPVDDQDVWAAGVTYVRSRDARLEESGRLDAYDKVYVADRPELFWKAGAGRHGDRARRSASVPTRPGTCRSPSSPSSPTPPVASWPPAWGTTSRPGPSGGRTRCPCRRRRPTGTASRSARRWCPGTTSSWRAGST